MGKSTNGPDWIDVEMTMRALEGLHEGHVSLIVSPEGIGSSGGLNVIARMTFDVLPGSDRPASIEVAKRWPCGTCKNLPGHCWTGLIELDYRASGLYKQQELPI